MNHSVNTENSDLEKQTLQKLCQFLEDANVKFKDDLENSINENETKIKNVDFLERENNKTHLRNF